MKRCFCTIITTDYFPFALTLNDSLAYFDPSIELSILVADNKRIDRNNLVIFPNNIKLYNVNEVCKKEIGLKIFEKYASENMDNFRWSMKPVFVNYLLSKQGYDKVIYADCDLFFYNAYSFLFDDLDKYNVLLSPHWRCSVPFDSDLNWTERENFQMLFNKGIFNGGLVGVNKNGVEAMDWWAKACEYVCIIDECKGYFVDQSHLNLLPVLFENIGIIRHKGCNIANWNQIDCKRQLNDKNQLQINGKWDIICIHFTQSTILGILNKNDSLLKPYLDKYFSILKKYKADIKINEKVQSLIQQSSLTSQLSKNSRLLHIVIGKIAWKRRLKQITRLFLIDGRKKIK